LVIYQHAWFLWRRLEAARKRDQIQLMDQSILNLVPSLVLVLTKIISKRISWLFLSWTFISANSNKTTFFTLPPGVYWLTIRVLLRIFENLFHCEKTANKSREFSCEEIYPTRMKNYLNFLWEQQGQLSHWFRTNFF